MLLADAINVTLKEGEQVFVFTPSVLDEEINEALIFPTFSQ